MNFSEGGGIHEKFLEPRGSTSILGANVTLKIFFRDFQKDIFLNVIKCCLIGIKQIFGTVKRKETQETRRLILVPPFTPYFTFQTGNWGRVEISFHDGTWSLRTLMVTISDFCTSKGNLNKYVSPEMKYKWTIHE